MPLHGEQPQVAADTKQKGRENVRRTPARKLPEEDRRVQDVMRGPFITNRSSLAMHPGYHTRNTVEALVTESALCAPPCEPKLNGAVELPNRTQTKEFYESYLVDFGLTTLGIAKRDWEHMYNYFQPHQALGLTPAKYLADPVGYCPPSHMS